MNIINETTIPDPCNKVCIPGDKLFSVSDNYRAGNGCFEFYGILVASLTGYVNVSIVKDQHSNETKLVEIRRKMDEKSHVIPSQGKIVTAKVELLTQKFAKCTIISVENTMLLSEFNSTLRKEDVREKERDKVELYKSVQPGDIILARVLGYGEAQTSYLLSIAEDQLGVIIGKGQNGQRLSPDPNDPLMMKALNSDYREMRKMFPSGSASQSKPGYLNQSTASTSVNSIFLQSGSSMTNKFSSSQPLFNSTLRQNNIPIIPRQPNFATTGFLNSVKNNVTKLVNKNLGFLPFSPPQLTTTAPTFSSSAPPTIEISSEISKQNQPNGGSEPEGRNWRMLKLFSGLLKDEDLPKDCECPQNNEDKLFPFPECHTEDLFLRTSPLSPSDDEVEEQPAVKRVKSTIALNSKNHPSTDPCSSTNLNKFLKPSTVATLSSLNIPVTSNNSIPGTSKMSTSTAIHPLELNTNLVNSKTTETTSKTTSPNQQRGHLQQQQPSWKQPQQQTINGKKRFTNKSLLILKSGKRVYAGSKECYQFADTGACQAGIFCVFEHGKSLKHMQQKVCQRLMRGVCRGGSGGDDCPGGLHSPLLPHQMPVCDFYLRLVCSKGKDECNYLHVRHTPGTEPCAEFNRGCCHRGILVCFSLVFLRLFLSFLNRRKVFLNFSIIVI
ncbi:unnamed protein product [Meloidogyne enterolobii]|uniref:Uncharacterized protein n=1 Tax=Meloidogyne enterolobii TaxID=390850 RepID=A0ACB0Z1W3_MELEN